MKERYAGIVAAAAIVLALTGPDPAGAQALKEPLPAMCQVPYDLLTDSSPLPHAAKQLKAQRRLKIVALGSSSTLGMGASGPDAAYPAGLEAALVTHLPGVTIQVVNKGLSRQSAKQMLERIATDVLAERPSLVVWETGTAEAVRGADIDEFTTALLAGVDRMTAAGIDVVLMDTQYSRNTARIINFQPYVDAIGQVAGMRDLFGQLEAAEPRQVALRGGILLLVTLALTFAVVAAMPAAFPAVQTASFFSHSLVEPKQPFSIADVYFTANPFHSLSNAVVPAVVLFSSAIAIGLIGLEGKERVLGTLRVLNGAIVRITDQHVANERLAQVNALLADTQRAAGIGSYSYDVNANRLEWSEQLYRMLGVVPGTPAW